MVDVGDDGDVAHIVAGRDVGGDLGCGIVRWALEGVNARPRNGVSAASCASRPVVRAKRKKNAYEACA